MDGKVSRPEFLVIVNWLHWLFRLASSSETIRWRTRRCGTTISAAPEAKDPLTAHRRTATAWLSAVRPSAHITALACTLPSTDVADEARRVSAVYEIYEEACSAAPPP